MQIKVGVVLFVCTLVFSSSVTVIKMMNSTLTPINISFLRTMIAVICLLPFIPQYRPLVTKYVMLLIGILGLLGVFVYNISAFYALEFTTPTNLALINAITPVVTILAAALILKERISKRILIACLLSFIGIGFVITKGELNPYAFTTSIGECIMLIGMLAWVGYSLIAVRLSKKYSSVFIAYTVNFIGMLLLLPLALYQNVGAALTTLTIREWIPLLYNGIGTALGFFLYSYALKRCGASITAFVIFSTMPIVSAFFDYILLGEPVYPAQIIGCALIILSLAIGLMPGSQKTA